MCPASGRFFIFSVAVPSRFAPGCSINSFIYGLKGFVKTGGRDAPGLNEFNNDFLGRPENLFVDGTHQIPSVNFYNNFGMLTEIPGRVNTGWRIIGKTDSHLN